MALPSTYAAHAAATERLLADYAAIPAGEPVRLAKRTSNLFRTRTPTTRPGLDVASFNRVLAVDPEARLADVQGMTTYEDLVDATLPHGLIPLVVPQLKTITLGGAVTGLGIESTSFRNGCPHESVVELEVLTGDGRVILATPENEHRDLYYGFANSYGTLGYSLRLRIELEPVLPYVALEHHRHTSVAALVDDMVDACNAGDADFVDGVVFGPSEAVLTVRDYLWRWDTDWFWCSRAFGAQHPVLRRIWPEQYLRSDVYWKIAALENRYRIASRIDAVRGFAPKESVIQDVEVPADRAESFLAFLLREIPIRPVWLCPLRQRDPKAVYDLYALDPSTLYINAGFWSTMALGVGEQDGEHNRAIELAVAAHGGRKSLYSTSYYPEDEFWGTYNGPAYDVLKKTYDADSRLLDLYAKTVERR